MVDVVQHDASLPLVLHSKSPHGNNDAEVSDAALMTPLDIEFNVNNGNVQLGKMSYTKLGDEAIVMTDKSIISHSSNFKLDDNLQGIKANDPTSCSLLFTQEIKETPSVTSIKMAACIASSPMTQFLMVNYPQKSKTVIEERKNKKNIDETWANTSEKELGETKMREEVNILEAILWLTLRDSANTPALMTSGLLD